MEQQVKTQYNTQFVGIDDKPCTTTCILCEETFILPTNEKDFLSHLFKEHRLVIGDVWKIASLKSYVRYWRHRFKENCLTDFCTTLLMDCTPDGKPSKNENYFLLSDCTAEDKTLRDELHRVKMEWVLAHQSQEWMNVDFNRGCMFCRTEFSGSRLEYIKHLSQKHNLYLGKPENLVFIDQLLDKIQNAIESLICIYCEKVFKDRTALKEHMRKKLHKRINPRNNDYDKFYINNYLEPGRLSNQREKYSGRFNVIESSSESEDEESSWSDWNGDSVGITCLFCDYKDDNFTIMLQHIKENHDFNFEEVTKELTFYQKIKLVNYIRRQTYLQCCIFCNTKVENVLEHMIEQKHFKLPKQQVWDQPEFYFPKNENDSFLYYLDTSIDSDEETGVTTMIEDTCIISD